MKNRKLIDKFSRLSLITIFNFIEDKTLPLKLFIKYPKYHKRFKINLSSCKQKYLESNGFFINDYLFQSKHYAKDELTKKYKKFFYKSELVQKKIEQLIYEIKNDENERIIKEDYETKINIDSPLLEIISKTKNYEKNYTIYLSQIDIDENNLKKYYISLFSKTNINFSSIYYVLKDKKKINYLRELNINFNKIKRMTLIVGSEENNDYINKCFFEILFSFNHIENNLIFLKIECKFNNLSNKLFENINNFKSLKYLYINSFKFDTEFIITIKHLNILSCKNFKNIILSEDINFKDLKELYLYGNDTYSTQALEKSKFENLEKLYLNNDKISDIDKLKIANIRKLKELNLSNNNISDINILKKVKFSELEILNLSSNKISDIKILEKVKFKNLKKLILENNNISDLSVLEKVIFKKLEILNLSQNKISDINILEKVKFKELKRLNLSYNNISDINVLENINISLKNIEQLDFSSNKISDIKVLEKIKLEKLEVIDLRKNRNLKSKFQFINNIKCLINA